MLRIKEQITNIEAMLDSVEVKIRLISGAKNPDFAGIATVTLFGCLDLASISIWVSKDGVGFQNPYNLGKPKGNQRGAKYFTHQFTNREVQQAVFDKILKEYKRVTTTDMRKVITKTA